MSNQNQMEERDSYSHDSAPEEKHAHVLLTTLAEYSAKLKTRCEEIDQIKRSQLWQPMAIVAAIGTASIGSALFVLPRPGDSVVSLVGATLAAVSAFVTAWVALFSVTQSRRGRIRKEEVAILADQVGRLIRLASQFESHGKQDFTVKMLFDLRLAEAEAALRYCEAVVGSAAK